jgi:hypothetical protein
MKLFITLILIMTFSLSLIAQPTTITYQGKLLDNSDMPVNEPAVAFTFAIWDAETGGNKIWPPNNSAATKSIDIVNGLYSVILGTGSGNDQAIEPGIFNGITPYLEVGVNATTLPRTSITSVPFSILSNNLSSIAWASPGAIGSATPNSGTFTALTVGTITNSFGSSADPSAMLEVESTTKGFLPPRMTQEQRDAIVSPAAGLMIYNTTTNLIDFFNAVKWNTLTLNQAPIASNVSFSSFSGLLVVGDETITGSYTYSDEDNNLEGTSIFQWYRADDGGGSNQAIISGANALTYTLQAADENKHISFEVTPVAQGGAGPGTTVMSAYQGPVIAPALTDVFSGNTGKFWMDRNLGASQVATSSTDADSYGDLYQWGRGTDGHQVRTSGTTATNATTAVPNDGNVWDGLFITEGIFPFDWLTTQNDNLWQGVSGTNNPCPSGYRLPTEAEWEAERLSWSSQSPAGAFASPLKLPVAGRRYFSDGSLGFDGYSGYYWSATVDGAIARSLLFGSSNAFMISSYRAYGYSVRCLKD